MRSLLFFVLVLVACSKTPSATEVLTQARDNPAGSWTISQSRASFTFTVSSERIERIEISGVNVFKASGTVNGLNLTGFLVKEDAEAPAGYASILLHDNPSVDSGYSLILRVDGQELVLGGDQPSEPEQARLRKN